MTLLRALMPLPAGEELQVRWDEDDAKRDILTVIRRRIKNYIFLPSYFRSEYCPSGIMA